MTTITAADLYLRAARVLRSRSGLLGTVTPVTVEAIDYLDVVLVGLVNTRGDPTFMAGDVLYLPDSPAGSREALIISWTDVTGTVRIIAQATTPTASDRYAVFNKEDYVLNEYQFAFEKALAYTSRTYRQVVPLTPNLKLYPLVQCPWLKGAGDIDAAWLSYSPVQLHNEDMSLWQDGPSAAPDGYTLTGTGVTVTRLPGGMRSSYKAHIVAGSTVARLEQPVPDSLVAWMSGRTQTAFVRYPVRPFGWASTPDASSVRFYVYDGTTRHYTDYLEATANGVPQFAETALTPEETQTAYTWGIEIAATKSADLHVAGQVQDTQTVTLTYSIKQQGSQAFREQQILIASRNLGGVPTVELPDWPGGWLQLIVRVRRPFPAYGDDDDTIEEQYVPGLMAGTLRYLLEPRGPDEDRTRLDPIMAQQASDWSRFVNNIVDLPPKPPLNVYNVMAP